jgi:pyruvate kinase
MGPATDAPEVVRALIRQGMDVARFNFSHGTHEEHALRMKTVREIALELNRPVALMLDTKGPEIRTGKLKQGKVKLLNGRQIILTSRTVPGDENEIHISFPDLAADVKPGDRILIADGCICLEVERTRDQDIFCRVVYGGELGEEKGVNVPGVRTKLPFLSAKDINDIEFGLDQGIDFIAASFVRNRDDLLDIRRILERRHENLGIIAKIESQESIENLEEIIKVADGIMVARGDLGVEIPAEEVPLVQKNVIKQCNQAGKIVIIATQMLESMINSPRPTRAEASDVANAILDGADTLMLSGETAAGAYPVEAVETMARIALRTEKVLPYAEILAQRLHSGSVSVTDAISHATCTTAQDLNASAIITATQSGYTARMVSKHRPRSPIIAATPSEKITRSLNLVWGVTPILVARSQSTDQMIEDSVAAALNQALIKEGDMVVITAGVPTGVTGTTNLLKVHVVAEVLYKGTGIGKTPVTGRVRVVLDPLKAEDFQPGDILVAVSTDRDFMPLFQKAGAVLTEEGGLTSHAAIVGLNLGVPVVVGLDGVTGLPEGLLITVDTSRGVIYRGEARVI